MDAARPAYQYQNPLTPGYIRVLLLHPDQSLRTASGQKLAHFALHTVRLNLVIRDLPEQDPNSPAVLYSALSYVWGNQDTRHTIAIDHTTFEVGENLFAALCHLLGRFVPPYWIDAICINQNDDTEKEGQLKQMGDVYRKARRVIVWLGPGDAERGKAMAQIDKIGASALAERIDELTAKHLKQWPDFGMREQWSGIRTGLEAVMNSSFAKGDFPVSAFLDLMDNAWFERAWTMQELAVANHFSATFVCGTDQISYEHLAPGYKLFLLWYAGHLRDIKAATSWPSKVYQINKFYRRVGILLPRIPNSRAAMTLGFRKRFWEASGEHIDLMELLTSSYALDSATSLKCHDPRDKIYALKGLTKDAAFLGGDGLYSRPFQKLFIDVARHLVSSGNLDVLSLCRGRPQEPVVLDSFWPPWSLASKLPSSAWPEPAPVSRASVGSSMTWTRSIGRLAFNGRPVLSPILGPTLPGRDASLPSWVPDWSAPIGQPWGLYKANGLFQACLQPEVNSALAFSGPQMSLRLCGWQVDTIKELGEVWQASVESFDWLGARMMLETVERFVKKSSRYPQSAQPHGIPDAIWRIPIGNKEHNELMQTVIATKASHQASLEMKKELCRWLPGTRIYSAAFTSYMNMMWSMYDSRPFISLAGGYVGLCPAAARAGDGVYCLAGCHVPYILRESAPGRHTLVGEAYVEGIMHGEFDTANSTADSIEIV
ncbi:hypothetical protein LTR85_010202 [Meristemomyces frigidus]|nr:hypothetical protein LTR85_010202 [Meristemomyces frigidus]